MGARRALLKNGCSSSPLKYRGATQLEQLDDYFSAAPYTESRLTRSVANERVGFPVVEQRAFLKNGCSSPLKYRGATQLEQFDDYFSADF